MYAAHIGRRLVALYNEHRHDGPPLSPREFFDDIVFPVFFDDETFLMWVGNAPFDQAYKQRAKTPMTHDVLVGRREELHEKLDVLPEPYWHLFIGGFDKSRTDLFSGQISSLERSVDAEDAICSWIGAGAGIGLNGGLTLLIDEEELLLALIDGWKQYRRLIRETPSLKGNQIETWNGWWLTHRLSNRFDKRRPFRDFPRGKALKKRGGGLELATQDWVRILFALAHRMPSQTLNAYVYSIGYKGNETVGFRQFRLPEVSHFADLYIHLFGEVDGIKDPAQLAALYQADFTFRVACCMGTIGLRAIQPNKLRDYIPKRGGAKKKPKPPKKDAQLLTYHQYLTWIIAMLDNKDLISLAEEAAHTLRAHSESGTKARSTQQREAEQVLDASGRRVFIEGLTEIVQGKDADVRERLDELVDAIIGMPASDFPLLLTLMRFKYHTQV